MAKGANLRIWGPFWLAWAGMALEIFFLAGCGKNEPALPKLNVISQANGSSEPAQIDEKPDLDPRLHQPFSQATVANPPANWQRPPDLTMTNKSVGKLYTEVVRIWDEIKYVSPKGLPLAYRAMLETELGEIEIALRPDLAPNHVRSFVALAKVGYYDGLVFERTIHQTVEGRADAKIEIIEAGCPMGTGDAGYGSIGYWLKPEFHPQAFHEEGTVGASLGEEADTAACKFYINLHKAPYMDGNYTVFGKVTKGLNVARKILSLPVRNDPEYPEGDRPEKRVVIRKVTIQAEEVNK